MKEYEDLFVAMNSLGSYYEFYIKERRHQGLKGLTYQGVWPVTAGITRVP